MRRTRTSLSFANVMSVIAVFVALGGSAIAVTLARNSVGSPQIKPSAVRSSDIARGAVRTSDIAGNAVTAGKIPANAVGASEIDNESVTDSEIAANAVENDEIAPNSVNSSRIADGTVGINDAAPSLQLTCGTGLSYLSGVCIQNANNLAANWTDARAACNVAALDGRLPSFEELELLRQRAGFNLDASGEWTALLGNADGDTAAEEALVLADDGTVIFNALATTFRYRCVTQPLGAPG